MRARIALLAAASLVTVHEADGAQITVGPNVQVSKAKAGSYHEELLADADPANPRRLVVCTHIHTDARTEHGSMVYVSHDGGATWKPTLEEYPFGDPTCTYGPDGAVYFMAFAFSGDSTDLRLWRSRDGGLTWEQPSKTPVADREFLTVDRTGGKYHGRVYINATGSVRGTDSSSRATALTVYHSADGGNSFRGPVQRAAFGPRYVLGMGNGVVLSDGTYGVLFGELKDYGPPGGGSVKDNTRAGAAAVLRFVTSKDGGETLESPATVADYYMHGYPWMPANTSITPYVGVDPGSAAFKDRLYAVWTDRRSSRDEIFFSYSADSGKTWSKAAAVSDDRSTMDNFQPMIAVNRVGVVGIAWYDRRDNPDNLGWWVRFRASLDGGETWLPSVRVAEQPNAYTARTVWPLYQRVDGGGTPGRYRRRGGLLSAEVGVDYAFYHGGHTAGMAVDANGVFHPVWVDNRTGVSQVWTAPVTVRGTVAKHGSAELAQLTDITNKATLRLTEARYDRATNRISLSARLQNTSRDTLRGPIKVRVVRLASDVGVSAIVDADGGGRGAGAILDFTGLLPAGVLAPDSMSAAKPLVFELTDVRPFRQGQEFKFGLVSLDTRVLGRAEPGQPR